MADIFARYNLNDIGLDVDDPTHIIQRIRAEVTDMTDNTIIDACIKTAKEAGINNLYLMDRQFMMDALREKIQRTQQETPRWISVEERLPENYISVIGYLPIDEKEGLPPTREVYRTEKGWFAPSLGEFCIVTHWMSMPEGFREV